MSTLVRRLALTRRLKTMPPRVPWTAIHPRQLVTRTGEVQVGSPPASGGSPLHVLGGIACFITAERASAMVLDALSIELPSSIAALIALGCVVTPSPSVGARVHSVLGPGSAWLRAALPLVTVPAFLLPAAADTPSAEALPKLALLCSGAILATTAVAGHVARAMAGATTVLIETQACASTAAATRVLNSPYTAAGAMLVGFGATLTMGLAASLTTTPPAIIRAPAYVGLSVAAYVAASRLLPQGAKKFCPPNVGCAILLLGVLMPVGGLAEVRCYLECAGTILMSAVHPAMVTLGLYAHSHRAILREQRLTFAILASAVAPALLFTTAFAGRAIGLKPEEVASVLPASTTTGLALTMPTGCPLIRQEWVAAGTAFFSGVTQVTMPLLLATTGLGSACPPLARGVAVGAVAHVGGMAALIAAGDLAAGEFAAVALVACGVSRGVMMQCPPISRALAYACGGDEHSSIQRASEG